MGQIAIISAGDYSTCVKNNLGAAFCWGANSFGQLGDGTLKTRTVPVEVTGGLTFETISAGDHACGTLLDGKAMCWGKGSSGELGNGALSSSPLPVEVAGGLTFGSVAVGVSSCGFSSTGETYCWGPNDSGQLGTGDFTPRSSPALVTGGIVFVRFAMGARTACGSSSDGTAYCWGNGEDGELGDGSFGVVSAAPVPVAGAALQFAAFSIGGSPDGAAAVCGGASDLAGFQTYCWGSNTYGQLGDGTTQRRNVPGIISASLYLDGVVIGRTHACGRGPGAEAYCWGAGGLLGNGTGAASLTPTPVAGNLVFATLTAGAEHTCGRTEDTDEMYCWGANNFGQLGDGSTIRRLVPVKVLGQS